MQLVKEEKIRLLLAEDDYIDQEAAIVYLRDAAEKKGLSLGFGVAGNANKPINKLEENAYDLVVTDLMMPNSSNPHDKSMGEHFIMDLSEFYHVDYKGIFNYMSRVESRKKPSHAEDIK